MGSAANRLRNKWQDYSGKNAGVSEKDLYETFKVVFANTDYQIRNKPKEFKNIYLDIKLTKEELSEIYTPPETITRLLRKK